MSLSPIDVAQKQFSNAFRGANAREVETFLQEVSVAMTALVQQRNDMQAELTAQKRLLDLLHGRENEVKEALMTAQRAVEQVRSTAEREAQLKIEEAELKGQRIVADAQGRHTTLTTQIGELTRQRARFIEELRGIVATHARMLELYGCEAPSALGLSEHRQQGPILEVLEAPVPPSFMDPASRSARGHRRVDARSARQKE